MGPLPLALILARTMNSLSFPVKSFSLGIGLGLGSGIPNPNPNPTPTPTPTPNQGTSPARLLWRRDTRRGPPPVRVRVSVSVMG